MFLQSKDKGVDLRQQSFDGSDSVKPTFVTPKVTQQARKDDSSRKVYKQSTVSQYMYMFDLYEFH